MIKNIINFYAQCYIAGNRQLGIRNLLKSNIEGLYFIPSIQSIQTEYNPIHVDEEEGVKLLKQLELYKNDKRVIVTYLGFKHNGDHVIPLYLIPGKLTAELNNYVNNFSLEIDIDKKYINPEFEQYLKKNISKTDYTALINILNEIQLFTEEDFIKLHLCLENIKSLNIDHFDSFKNILLRKQIKKIENNSFFSQLSIGLIRKSIKTRSVLSELEQSKYLDNYSDPLKFLFGDSYAKNGKPLNIFSPFTLNTTQESVAKNCMTKPISLVTGPPGTGKSFTIAAIALNAAMQGKSVLISSKTDQAVDVIANKLHYEFDAEELFMRGGGGAYKKELKFRLKQIVSFKNNTTEGTVKSYLKTDDKLRNIKVRIKKLEKAINKRLEVESDLSTYLIAGKANFFSRFWKERKIKKTLQKTTIVKLIEEYQKVLNHQLIYQRQYINQLYKFKLNKGVNENRKKINSFNASLGAQTNQRKESYFSQADIKSLFEFFPIWLTNLKDVGNVFPFEKNLFDLVIIDEASQVDIANSIPVLQRAKHAIIVGDPMQLRHISFLSQLKEDQLKEKNQLESNSNVLSYRSSSLYDMCDHQISGSDQIYTLNEHYRSKPGIINFSNQYYYGAQMVNFKTIKEHDLELGLKFINIDGFKNDKGINQKEIDYVFKIIKAILKHKRVVKSLGIISPFRDQVDAIRKQVDERLSFAEIKKLNLRIDTPYGFQGDERDIIILSLVIDSDNSPMVHQYLNKPGVFNVSITRARENQHVLFSFKPTQLPTDSILRKYFEFEHKEKGITNNYKDEFLSSITNYLKSIGIDNFTINKELGSSLIDISFYHNEQLYAIDLIGFPGAQEEYLHLEEHQMLERMNKQLIVVSYFAWELDRKRIEQDIYTRLNEVI